MKRIIIAGSRNVEENKEIKLLTNITLSLYGFKDIVIIQGGAKGIDALGKKWAKTRNNLCVEFKADWEMHGKLAGPIRNQVMAEYACEEDMKYSPLLLAFPSRTGKGTQDMIRKALAKGMDIIVEYID